MFGSVLPITTSASAKKSFRPLLLYYPSPIDPPQISSMIVLIHPPTVGPRPGPLRPPNPALHIRVQMLYNHDDPIPPPTLHLPRHPLGHCDTAMHTCRAIHQNSDAGTGPWARVREPVLEPGFQESQRTLVLSFVGWDREEGVGYFGGDAGVSL